MRHRKLRIAFSLLGALFVYLFARISVKFRDIGALLAVPVMVTFALAACALLGFAIFGAPNRRRGVDHSSPTIEAKYESNAQQSMKYRKLRIAWSVMWVIVVVLLCAMWIRSYWALDKIYTRPTKRHELSLWHARGELILWTNDLTVQASKFADSSSRFKSYSVDEYPIRRSKFDFSVLDYGTSYGVPYWFAVLLTIILIGIPWITLQGKFNQLGILVTLLVVLLAMFFIFGLVAKIIHDLNETWPPVQ